MYNSKVTPHMSKLLSLTLFLAVCAFPQQQGKTAAEAFKNITVLKDIPADQLMPAMQVMNSAFNGQCTFCHVQGKMEADGNDHKRIAREMITMVANLNKTHFEGRQVVTCYTCHRNEGHPSVAAPVMTVDQAAKPKDPPPPAASNETVDQILQRYVTALGGEEAIRKINSRVMKGVVAVQGKESPIEVYTKAPNKRLSITRSEDGAGSYTVFDGSKGWMGNSGRPAREMGAPDAMAAGFDAEFYLPLRIKQMYPKIRKGRPERASGFDCDVLIGDASAGTPAARFYFDRATGLLLRVVRTMATPVGPNLAQVDYEDFRPVDGVVVPHGWGLSRANGRFRVQIAEVKSNVAIEDSFFTKPDGNVK